MQTEVFNLNSCIWSYNILDNLSDSTVKFMYNSLLEEYNINRKLIYKMNVVKYDYFYYLYNLYNPHIKYMRDKLVSRKIDADSIDKKMGLKISD